MKIESRIDEASGWVDSAVNVEVSAFDAVAPSTQPRRDEKRVSTLEDSDFVSWHTQTEMQYAARRGVDDKSDTAHPLEKKRVARSTKALRATSPASPRILRR